MNRRQFLTTPALALPLALPALAAPAAQPSVVFYDYWKCADEMDMRLMVVDRQEAYMVTRYFKPDPSRYHVGVGVECEYFNAQENEWARRFYPEAFDPPHQTGIEPK